MRKIAGYLTKNRSEKDQKIAQSTHENGYIKPRKTFWRNSKQLLTILEVLQHPHNKKSDKLKVAKSSYKARRIRSFNLPKL